MESLGFLIGHLVGDYILQNDWMAKNKSNPIATPFAQDIFSTLKYSPIELEQRSKGKADEYRGHVACTIHCLLYTLAIFLFSYISLHWTAYLIIFLTHWFIDRFRLAKILMVNLLGQKEFATGLLSPWSIIVVDNTLHLMVLYSVGLYLYA